MSADLHQAAGALLAGLRQSGAAAADMVGALEALLAAQPGHDAARLALAACLWSCRRHRDAVAQYRRLVALHPQDARLACALGRALVQTGGADEGEVVLRALAAQVPEYAEAQAWWGLALFAQRRHAQALAPLAVALALRPGERDWHMARAEALLALGRWTEGWAEHAWRWQGIRPDRLRVPAAPLIRPHPAGWNGKTVLLYAEQGHGDTLQCLRYVAPAAAAGARVVLEVQPALLRLAAAMPGVAEAVAAGGAVPPHDIAVPMFNLPWAFGTTPDYVPDAPYLSADVAATGRWRGRLSGIAGRKIGLVWAGEPRPENLAALATDRHRSIPLAALGPLTAVPGLAFVSLQKGAAAAQPPPPGMELHDWTAELADFADTAALVAALDLVISVDTGPVHLAGALGRPTWLLNRHDTCWRWLLDRADSPWYPTLRQFRQTTPGDWAGVVARVAAELVR